MKIPKHKIKRLKRAAKDGQSIIHFSELENKLGINPRTNFNTPAGVYGYILTKDSLKCIVKDHTMTSSELVNSCNFSSFATDRDFVYVAEIKPSRNKNVVHIHEDGQSDMSVEEINDKINQLIEMAIQESSLINHYYRTLNRKTLEEEIIASRSESYTRTPFGEFWNITRNFARNPIAWGSLLYELGISAVFDHGSGIIYDDEPSQAVIFETNKIDVLYHGKNILSKYVNNTTVLWTYKKLNKFLNLMQPEKSNFNENNTLDVFHLDVQDDSLFNRDYFDTENIIVNNNNPGIVFMKSSLKNALKRMNYKFNSQFYYQDIKIVISIDVKREEIIFFMVNQLFHNKGKGLRSMRTYNESYKRNGNIDKIYFAATTGGSIDSSVMGIFYGLPESEEDLLDIMDDFVEEAIDIDPEEQIEDFFYTLLEISKFSPDNYILFNLSIFVDVFGHSYFLIGIKDVRSYDGLDLKFEIGVYCGSDIKDKKEDIEEDFNHLMKFAERLDLSLYERNEDELDYNTDSYKKSVKGIRQIKNQVRRFVNKYRKDKIMIELN